MDRLILKLRGKDYAETKGGFGILQLAPGTSPQLDIIAVHGLDGDRERSWTHKGNTAERKVMWLKTLLPERVPHARILTYGYDTYTRDREQLTNQSIHDHAETLVAKLVQYRRETDTENRPIIFIAHSLGGIVLKTALFQSSIANKDNRPDYKSIELSTYGMILLGTPHQGSDAVDFAIQLLRIKSLYSHTNDQVLKNLRRDSPELQAQLSNFASISSRFDTKFFYEAYETRVGGIQTHIVPKSSASLPGAVGVEVIALYKDHIGMAKFGSADDDDFQTICRCLNEMVKKSSAKIAERWRHHKKHEEIDSGVASPTGYRLAFREHFDRVNDDERMTTLLNALQSLPFQEKHRDLQMRRMEGLGQWLLNTPKFEEWREGFMRQNILWCHGGPGVGKSFLASVVIDHLDNRVELGGGRLLYFYFDYKRQSEQTPFNILVTLLRQLLSTCSSFPNAASDLYKRIQKGNDLPGWKDLMVAFRNICASSSEELFLVFDALDECDEKAHRQLILDLLEFMSESNVRVLVTSRPYPPDINDAFANYPQIVIEAADADIRAFLLEKITKSGRKSSRFIDETLRQEIIQLIAATSQGMFLLPALQIDNILGQTNPRQVREALRTLPSALVDNLDLTMERIKSQDSQGQPRTDLAMGVLMWLSNAKRPLTVNELQHATAVIPGMARLVELTDPSFFTECCLGLVTIDIETSIVRLVHLSINEYLQDRAKILFPFAHGELAITCLTYLSLDDFYGVKLSTKDDLDKLSSKFHFLGYAVSYWGIHAAICFDAEVERTTREFLDNRPLLELWNQLYEGKEAGPRADSDISQYIVRDMSALHVSAIFGIEKLAQTADKDNSSNPNPRDSLDRSPLMLAAAYGQKALLKLLLSRDGIRINLTDLESRTALGFAVDRAQVNIVQMLLSCSNIDINTGNPFVAACEKASHNDDDAQSCTQIVKLFLSRPDLDVNATRFSPSSEFCCSDDDYAAWEWIGRTLDWQPLRMLLSREDFDPSSYFSGGEVERKSGNLWNYMINMDYTVEGWTLSIVPIIHALDADHRFRLPDFAFLRLSWPFLYFAFADGVQRLGSPGAEYYSWGTWISDNVSGTLRTKLRESLEELGFSFDTRDAHGRTYLHLVAQSYKEYDLHFLLQRGADVSATDNYGFTPLHYAAKEAPHEYGVKGGQIEHIAILLDAGADVSATNNYGCTPLHYAAKKGQIEHVAILLDAGAVATAADHKDSTVLHWAVGNGDESIVQMLLDCGADLHARDKSGETVLHVAARSKDSEPVISLLIDRGAESLINTIDNFCTSPLHDAAWYERVENCRLLLQRGANPNLCSTVGTPLHVGAHMMNEKIILAILSSGGDPNLLDCYGHSSFDWIARYKPLAEKMGTIMLMYKPTPPHVTSRRLLESMRERIDLMISVDNKTRDELRYRLGKQLLYLGDEGSARTIFETFITTKIKSNVIESDDSCDQCFTDTGHLYYCKTCPIVRLCSKCLEDRKDDKMPWCQGHDFLKVPGDGWKDLPMGVVNKQGQNFEEWLKDLQKKYCSELTTNGVHQDGQ